MLIRWSAFCSYKPLTSVPDNSYSSAYAATSFASQAVWPWATPSMRPSNTTWSLQWWVRSPAQAIATVVIMIRHGVSFGPRATGVTALYMCVPGLPLAVHPCSSSRASGLRLHGVPEPYPVSTTPFISSEHEGADLVCPPIHPSICPPVYLSACPSIKPERRVGKDVNGETARLPVQ